MIKMSSNSVTSEKIVSEVSSISTIVGIVFLGLFIGILLTVYLSRTNELVTLGGGGVSTGVVSIDPTQFCETCSIATLPTSVLQGGRSGGKKRAILIGCNYSFPGSACEIYDCTLRGCISDVHNISSILTGKLGYLPQDISLIVDDGSTTLVPNKQTIITQLTNLMNEMVDGDVSFIWYSGHGVQVRNPSAEGGFNECWCPVDTIASGDYLTDMKLNEIIRLAPSGSNVFIGSDACHSGTVFDLKYMLTEPDGTNANRSISISSIRGRNALPEGIFAEKKFLAHDNLATNMVSGPKKEKTLNGGVDMVVLEDSFYSPTNANVISLSGCQNFDTSADAWEEGMPQGAMSWAFDECFDISMSMTDILRDMRTLLSSSGYDQVPQLSLGILQNPNITTLGSFLSPN